MILKQVNTRAYLLDYSVIDVNENSSLDKQIIAEAIEQVANDSKSNEWEYTIDIKQWVRVGIFKTEEIGYEEKYIKQVYRDMQVRAMSKNYSIQSDSCRISHKFSLAINGKYIKALYSSDVQPTNLIKDDEDQTYTIKGKITGALLQYLRASKVEYFLDTDYYTQKFGEYKEIHVLPNKYEQTDLVNNQYQRINEDEYEYDPMDEYIKTRDEQYRAYKQTNEYKQNRLEQAFYNTKGNDAINL